MFDFFLKLWVCKRCKSHNKGELPAKFEGSHFQIVFPNISSRWDVDLAANHTEQSVPVEDHQNWQNIMIRRGQEGAGDEIPCTPQSFSYDNEVKVEVKYDKYNSSFYDGIYCNVTGI